MSKTDINSFIHIEHDVLKQVVADIVRQTPGIADVKKFFFNNAINSNENSKKVVHITNEEDGTLTIEFSIAIHYGHLVLSIPASLQEQIIKSIKYHFNLNAKVNIIVSDVIPQK